MVSSRRAESVSFKGRSLKTRVISISSEDATTKRTLPWFFTLSWDIMRYWSWRFRFYVAFINFWVVTYLLFIDNTLTTVRNHYTSEISLESLNSTWVKVKFTVFERTDFGYSGCRSSHDITQNPPDVQYSPDVDSQIFYCEDYCRDYGSTKCLMWPSEMKRWSTGLNSQGDLYLQMGNLRQAANEFLIKEVGALVCCGAGLFLGFLGFQNCRLRLIGVVRLDIVLYILSIVSQFSGVWLWFKVGDTLVDPDNPNVFERKDKKYIIINDPFNGAGDKRAGGTIWGLLIMCMIMLVAVLISHLSELYFTDYLTNLWTKAMLDVSLRMSIKYHQLSWIRKRRKLVMFSIDVDNFRYFNNKFEDHAVGDRALEIIGEALAKGAKTYNVRAFRRSGDEFVVLGWFSNMERAINCGMELVRNSYTHLDVSVHGSYWRDGRHQPHKESDSTDLSISVGMTAYLEGQSKQEWEKLTEKMLYIAKGSIQKLTDSEKEDVPGLLEKIQADPRNRLVYLNRETGNWVIKSDRESRGVSANALNEEELSAMSQWGSSSKSASFGRSIIVRPLRERSRTLVANATKRLVQDSLADYNSSSINHCRSQEHLSAPHDENISKFPEDNYRPNNTKSGWSRQRHRRSSLKVPLLSSSEKPRKPKMRSHNVLLINNSQVGLS